MDEGSMGSPMSSSGADNEPDIKRQRVDEQYETEWTLELSARILFRVSPVHY